MRIRYESDDGVTALDLARENRHDRCVWLLEAATSDHKGIHF